LENVGEAVAPGMVGGNIRLPHKCPPHQQTFFFGNAFLLGAIGHPT